MQKSIYFSISINQKLNNLKSYYQFILKRFGFFRANHLFSRALLHFVYLSQSSKIKAYYQPKERKDLVEAILWNIALYQTLQSFTSKSEAFSLIHEQVRRSGIELMQNVVAPLPDKGRMAKFSELVTSAFTEAKNIRIYDMIFGKREEKAFSFEVTYCLYAELCQIMEVPELGACFCDVDEPFFKSFDQKIRFHRTKTIAKGAEKCDFSFSETD